MSDFPGLHPWIGRLAHSLPDPIIDRFLIGYGTGINDVFFDEDQGECGLDKVLYNHLRKKGFDRIIFISPHRQLYFFDEETRDSLYGARKKKNSSSKQSKILHGGPLAGLNLLNTPSQQNQIEQDNGMGDVHALRLIDFALRDDSQGKVAVIFVQTETIFRYFDDPRTLSGLIGDWFRLPSTNRNLVLLLIGADSFSDLLEIAPRIPVPEVRDLILHRKITSGHLVQIPAPEIDEINRILKQKLIVKRSEEFDTIASWMENEQVPLKNWLARIDGCSQIDIAEAKSRGWFTAYPAQEEDINKRIEKLIGLETIKRRIQELTAWLLVKYKDRTFTQGVLEPPMLHMIFEGNPGTGKTTVARLMGEVFHELGLLKKGHLVEVKASDLISDHVGGTGLKTNRIIDQAIDGLLFIDEAYMLTEENRGGFGREALDTLLTRMEDDRLHLVVIAAGYPEKMKKFRKSNPGLTRRFPEENIFNFPDYSVNELLEILENMLVEREIFLDEKSMIVLEPLVESMLRAKEENFGNAGEMRNLAEAIDRRRALRIFQGLINRDDPFYYEDIPEAYRSYLPPKEIPIDDVLQDLDNFVGLTPVKMAIRRLVYQIQFEKIKAGESFTRVQKPTISRHMVFSGNPGTGKTSVARILGKIYKSLGILRKGHCIEVTRSDLVAGYIGQTALKTMEVVNQAVDGILFIDEAYSLDYGHGNDFGQEVIDTLIKVMDKFQDRLIVIVAGYPEQLRDFISTNPGLASRFPQNIEFPDFTLDEMIQIFHDLSRDEGYSSSDDVDASVRYLLEVEQIRLGNHFGNGRTINNLFNEMKGRLAERVMMSLTQALGSVLDNRNEFITQFSLEDVPHIDPSTTSRSEFIQKIPLRTNTSTENK